jgi:hypothetical protein
VAVLLVDAAHDEHGLHARLARPGHDRVAVRVELWHVDVGVGID